MSIAPSLSSLQYTDNRDHCPERHRKRQARFGQNRYWTPFRRMLGCTRASFVHISKAPNLVEYCSAKLGWLWQSLGTSPVGFHMALWRFHKPLHSLISGSLRGRAKQSQPLGADLLCPGSNMPASAYLLAEGSSPSHCLRRSAPSGAPDTPVSANSYIAGQRGYRDHQQQQSYIG